MKHPNNTSILKYTRLHLFSARHRIILFCSACILLTLFTKSTQAITNEIPQRVTRCFVPGKPAVKLSYNVAFRFLGLELRQLAHADITAVEGEWLTTDQNAPAKPACLVSFQLDSLEKSRKVKRGVILHNHILAVLTFPELDAILYAKRADEDIRVFTLRKAANNYEIYDLDDGSFRYTCLDLDNDSVSTNLIGAAELTQQGKEVCRFLKIIYDAYQTEPQSLNTPASNPPMFLYTEGDLVPFEFVMSRAHTPAPILGSRIACLFLKARPNSKAGGKGRNLDLWTAPFLEVAEHKAQDDLIALAHNTLQWSMVPLITDLGLALGCIRGTLNSLELVPLENVNVKALATPESWR